MIQPGPFPIELESSMDSGQTWHIELRVLITLNIKLSTHFLEARE